MGRMRSIRNGIQVGALEDQDRHTQQDAALTGRAISLRDRSESGVLCYCARLELIRVLDPATHRRCFSEILTQD